MQLILNGDPFELGGGDTVAALLEALQLKGRIAVEVNRCIVPRGDFGCHRLKVGDRVEIVEAIGGG